MVDWYVAPAFVISFTLPSPIVAVTFNCCVSPAILIIVDGSTLKSVIISAGGTCSIYSYASFNVELCPSGFVTTTSAFPAFPAGTLRKMFFES